MINTKEIIDSLKSLPIEDRALIADALLQSLNQPNEEIDTLWQIEIDKRIAEIDSGKVECLPGEEVFQKLREKYSK